MSKTSGVNRCHSKGSPVGRCLDLSAWQAAHA
jgi:hypothetical protein